MMNSWIIKAIKALLTLLILPFTFLAKAVDALWSGRLPRWVAIAVEASTVALVTILFAAVNWYFGLEQYLVGPPVLRKVWLGLLALLGYACVRLTLLLLRLLPRRNEEFPDIAAAMAAGCEALTVARIDARETPIFLVLGTDDSGDAAFASSPAVGEVLFGVREDAPVRWYGNHEAIWVTLPGVSAISAQAAHVADLSGDGTQNPAGLRLTVEEKEQYARRLRYFIKLLQRIRGPVVPMNGVLLAVPYRWISDPEYAALADTVQSDMQQLQANARVKCLCHVVFHDIENVPEFAAYLERLSDAERQQYFGCQLPHFTALGSDDVVPLHNWLKNFFRRHIFRLFQEQLDFDENAMLYRLLESWRHTEQGFCRLLTVAFSVVTTERFYLGGVCFAALSRSNRSLFDDVPLRMLRDHDEVIGWNDAALRREHQYRLWSSVLAAAVVVVVAADILVVAEMLIGGWRT